MKASEKLVLVYLATCSLTCALAAEGSDRGVRLPRAQSSHYDSVKLSTILDNDFTREPERKVSRLMGGHIKLTTTTESSKDSDEDVATWDDGLILSSAGNGKEKRPREDDDYKNSLSQQVKEGKYGLLQNEIFSKPPKRPGIISYLYNPEVPKDNAKNLGGLDDEEIWLAENHLLVLRGGNFPEQHETDQPSSDHQGWTPIDDYEAPKRQVKIPSRPKVPPPFPVQLKEGGPITVIGANETERPKWFEGLIPANETYLSSDWNRSEVEIGNDRQTKSGPSLGGIVGPFFPSLPPGAVFVPPPGNQSDYDDDDQSIYYPPPYSFKYTQDNSTAVPPGPLVPGIILPPPPDFFSQLEEKKTTKSHITKYPKRINTTPKSETYSTFNRKPSSKPFKLASSTTPGKEPRPFTMKPLHKFKPKNFTITYTESVTKAPEPFVEVTTPPTNKVSTLEISEINTIRPILTNQVIETSTEEQKSRWKPLTGKSSPIVAYYASTPPPTVDDPIETTPGTVKTIKPRRPQSPAPSSASYYFYEEAGDDVSGTTPTPVYFQESTTLYKAEESTKKPYYNVEVTPAQIAREEYNVEVIEPIVKSSPRYQYTELSPTPNPRSQGQRMLSDSPQIYYQTERPQFNLPTFYTTPPPTPETYNHPSKPKPVYQYSFEATNYAQRGRQKDLYKQEVNEPAAKQVTFNEWQEEVVDVGQQQYNDYDSEIVPEQRLQPERNHYRTRPIVNFPTTTVRPSIVNTTPNPAHAYYTKQEERLLDDVTREYFTNFGKKINKNDRLPSTTPIYGKSSVTERPNYPTANSYTANTFDDRQKPNYSGPRVKVHYGDQAQSPYPSLESDTRVNYQRPLPPINPDAEFLPGYGPKENEPVIERYRTAKPIRPYVPQIDRYNGQQIRQPAGPTSFVPLDDTREGQRIFPARPISLSGDIAVNYRDPRPAINPDAEFIDPGQAGINQDKPSSYFAYRLPGDAGHFYFLTPHAISQKQQDGNSYLYSRSRGSRFARRRRVPTNA
uniref:Uncharacterized protein n=1 Tax=Bracon brevicornis TaxID=1563983 RepID=A0A6V7LCM5_9HYME